MSAEKEIRRTNAWVRRRVRPSQLPKDEQLIVDYEFQIPSDWIDNLALWSKMMLVVITLSLFGICRGFLWVVDNVGFYR